MLESQPKYFGKHHYREYNKYLGKPPQAAAPGILGAPPVEEAKPKWEDKWTTLRAQRRAQGLCMKCGEKWGRNHKCPEKVSLHILEEVMDLLPEASKFEPTSDESSDDEVFSLSQAATVGVQGRKTIKITGLVNSQEILILIDSVVLALSSVRRLLTLYSVLLHQLLLSMSQWPMVKKISESAVGPQLHLVDTGSYFLHQCQNSSITLL